MTAAAGKSNSDLPAEDYFAITPNDSTDLGVVIRALVIATAGDVRVTKPNGTAVTLTLPAGVIPIRCSRVWATGTTATGLSGLV